MEKRRSQYTRRVAAAIQQQCKSWRMNIDTVCTLVYQVSNLLDRRSRPSADTLLRATSTIRFMANGHTLGECKIL